jgi:hypothetical protein
VPLLVTEPATVTLFVTAARNIETRAAANLYVPCRFSVRRAVPLARNAVPFSAVSSVPTCRLPAAVPLMLAVPVVQRWYRLQLVVNASRGVRQDDFPLETGFKTRSY